MADDPMQHGPQRAITRRGVLKHGNAPGDPSTAPRCGARTRRGTPCQGPAVHGKRRCRMHGGNSPGPPKGSQNALKHGLRSAAAVAARKERVAKSRQIAQGMAAFKRYAALADRDGTLTAAEVAEFEELDAWLRQPCEWDGKG